MTTRGRCPSCKGRGMRMYRDKAYAQRCRVCRGSGAITLLSEAEARLEGVWLRPEQVPEVRR